MKKIIGEILAKGGTIVDVRSVQEFKEAANEKSINIPMEQLSRELNRLDPNKPVVLCCSSGWKSNKAALMLKKQGFRDVYNACSWTNTLET